jgi:tRNA threonylcarbamoyladenosine biosynthesis protein TsaE
MCTTLESPEATIAWGRNLARTLSPGDVILLFGPLGAGKTTLVGGLAEGLGYSGPVVSPTYTILEVYEGKCPLYHFDFYRIESPAQLRAIDPREYYDQGITFMEWPERIEALWPRRRREIRIEYEGRWRTIHDQWVQPQST